MRANEWSSVSLRGDVLGTRAPRAIGGRPDNQHLLRREQCAVNSRALAARLKSSRRLPSGIVTANASSADLVLGIRSSLPTRTRNARLEKPIDVRVALH
jgi:hypothetical protein